MTDVSTIILADFPKRHILVVGDVMLDRYIRGNASRLSPEAPVPVLLSAAKHDALGGAANVARNIVALGGNCELAGLIGNDEPGSELVAICQREGIGAQGLIRSHERQTTVKTRVLSGNQQLLRIDYEDTESPDPTVLDRLYQSISAIVRTQAIDAIIVSDYAKGVTAPTLMTRLNQLASNCEIPIFVDPKGTDYEKYRGASVIKPNRVEMTEFARKWGWSLDDPVEAANQLRVAAGITHIALTLGDRGLAIVSDNEVLSIPTRAREVYDVTGAGDTVMAALVLAMTSKIPLASAADVANHAAAVVVARVGSSAVSAAELAQAIKSETGSSHSRKVYDKSSLTTLTERWRSEGKTIVFTNGCFDILHAGHTGLLQDARSLGDRLVLGLNSDNSISRLKGPLRPIMPVDQRTAVLGALEAVDAIIVYEEDTPLTLIEALKPDILVKGGDYDQASIVGADVVQSYGGRIAIVPITNDVSTSKLAAALERL